MKRKSVIIGDSDALIALLSNKDVHHKNAIAILSRCAAQDEVVYFSTTTIAETITTLQRKFDNPALAALVIEKLQAKNLPLLPVDRETVTNAMTMYHPFGSKQNTFFDAIVASMAKKYNATSIFSFDKWYEKLGFKLANSETL